MHGRPTAGNGILGQRAAKMIERATRFAKTHPILFPATFFFVLLITLTFAVAKVAGPVPIMFGDSPTYIHFEPHRTAGYPAVIAISQLLGLGLPGVAAFQLAAFSLALGYFFDVLRRRFGPALAVVVAGLAFANPAMLLSHYAIMTESLSYSLLLVIIGWGIEAVFDGRSVERVALISLCVGLSIAIRPAAWAQVPFLVLLWLFLTLQAKHRWTSWVAACVAPAVAVVFVAEGAAYVVNGNEKTSLAPLHFYAKSMLVSAGPAPADLSPMQARLWMLAENDGATLRRMIDGAPNIGVRVTILRRIEAPLESTFTRTTALPIALDGRPGPERKGYMAILDVAEQRLAAAVPQYLYLTEQEYLTLWMPFVETVYFNETAAYLARFRSDALSAPVFEGGRSGLTGAHANAMRIVFDLVCVLFGAAAVLLLVAPLTFLWIWWREKRLDPRLFVSGLLGLLVHGDLLLIALTGTTTVRYSMLMIPAMAVSLVFFFAWVCDEFH